MPRFIPLKLNSVAIFVCGLLFCFNAPVHAANDNIELQLRWKHAFQFAGYYMAKEKGYYADVGLNVTIIEGSPSKNPIQFVLEKEGRYAVSDSGALLAYANGKSVRVLAPIFQHSPLVLMVRRDSNIHSFSDLKGKRVMMQKGYYDAVILAAIVRAGLSESDIIRQDSSFNLHDLIDGHTDAFSAYTTDQPHQLEALGVPYRLLKPIEYDVDFYGDLLLTSDKEVNRYTSRVKRMKAATLKGWEYALEHIDETITLIRSKYNSQQLSLAQLQFEARKTAVEILKDEIELGYMSEYRWKHILKVYQELGLVDSPTALENFIYIEEPSLAEIFTANRGQLIIYVLLFILLLLAVQAVVLRRMVKTRTKELRLEREHLKASELLQSSVSSVLEMVVSDKPIHEVLQAIVCLYENQHSNMKASILLLKNGKLYAGATSSLPEAYNNAIDGLAIGPMVGSCGTAAFTKQRVIVEDIASDKRWVGFAHLAISNQLRACWSEPILNGKGEVIGTFDMYYDTPRAPSEKEIVDISNAARLAGIAIERKENEDNLRKLSRATEQSGEAVVITDVNGIIEYINPSFTKLTGFTPQEVIGTRSRLLRGGKQSDTYYDKVEKTLKSGKVWSASIKSYRKDNAKYPALVTISPIFDDANQVTHYVGTITDLSEFEVLEEKFRQAQKMESIGTLVGGIAHDFNNTLAGMTGNIYLAKRDTSATPDVLDKLDKIERLSFHAADTVQQLLAFARKGIVERQTFGLTRFLKETSKLHETSIPENIQFTEKFCDDELVVNADSTQIQQVLLNLLNNARDAVEFVKSPRISVSVDKAKVNDKFIKKNPTFEGEFLAHIKVTDNGSGIKDEDLERVFEPFFTTKEVGLGSGLGLSMVYGTIQSHGGAVDVSSKPGHGTTVHIYLPLLEEQMPDIAPDEKAMESKGLGELILIADDDADIRDTSKAVLENAGYRVIEAVDGEDAVNQFMKHKEEIALVMMDVVMPKLGGVEAVGLMHDVSPNTKVLYSSGYDNEKSQIFDAAGIEMNILSKPYRIDVLLEAVRKLIDSE